MQTVIAEGNYLPQSPVSIVGRNKIVGARAVRPTARMGASFSSAVAQSNQTVPINTDMRGCKVEMVGKPKDLRKGIVLELGELILKRYRDPVETLFQNNRSSRLREL